jgi:hypothetical protein
MCLAYHFKINDIYHYYFIFFIKIIIKQLHRQVMRSMLCFYFRICSVCTYSIRNVFSFAVLSSGT